MNLGKLFEMQKVLNERIIRGKGLEDQDITLNTVLALYAELGELLNECRFFKHWSDDKEMRREKALVEYVDGLHFILTIGLQLNIDDIDLSFRTEESHKYGGVDEQFKWIYATLSKLSINNFEPDYRLLVYEFISLGEMLGFTWDEIVQAYMDKNKVNHQRQESGY